MRDTAKSPDSAPSQSIQEGKGEIDRLVASVDWPAYGQALLNYRRVDEEARRKGKRADHAVATLEGLAAGNGVLEQLAQLLGLENSKEVLYHEKVWSSFVRGWLKAMGLSLSESQDHDLGESASRFAESRAVGLKEVRDANRLEWLSWEAEGGLQWDRELQRLLTPDQFALYANPGGSDPFWGRQAKRMALQSGDPDGTARTVEEFWRSRFGLEESARAQLAAAALGFAQEAERRVKEFRIRFPEDAPREERMRLKIGLLRLQAGAEQALTGSLSLSAQQREWVEQGSGTILEFRW